MTHDEYERRSLAAQIIGTVIALTIVGLLGWSLRAELETQKVVTRMDERLSSVTRGFRAAQDRIESLDDRTRDNSENIRRNSDRLNRLEGRQQNRDIRGPQSGPGRP